MLIYSIFIYFCSITILIFLYLDVYLSISYVYTLYIIYFMYPILSIEKVSMTVI